MISSRQPLHAMSKHHVTAVAALLVYNLVLTSASSAPNGALLKMLAAKQSHGAARADASPYLSSYRGASPSIPSPLEVEDVDDVSELWLGPGLALATSRGSPISGGNDVVEKDDNGVSMPEPVPSKRFHPSAFFGSRGKRPYGGMRFQHAFIGSRGRRGEERQGGARVAKRFNPSGFSGSRGKRYIPGLEALLLSQMYRKLDAEKWKRQSMFGFHAARG